jgi:hypothetical protein
MTMPPAAHPNPERLAALAGDDADARADRALVEHVASCAACDRQVDEMAALRVALAQLPDLAPPRPLQLVPPVPASAPSGWRVAFRRAFAPVAVAGIVLVLVGGVGATGALGPADAQRLLVLPFQQAASAPDPEQPEITGGDEGQTGGEATDDAGRPAAASAPPADNGGAESLDETPEPPTEVGGQGFEEPATRDEDLDAESTPTSGWVPVLAVGIGLLAVAVIFRAAASNRAPAGR